MNDLFNLSKLEIILIETSNHIFFSNSCHWNYIFFLWMFLFRTWQTLQKFDTNKITRDSLWSWFVHWRRFWWNHDKTVEYNLFIVSIHENVLWFENQWIFRAYHHILIECQICRSISIHFNVFRMIKFFFIFSSNSCVFFDASYKFSFFDSFDASSSFDFINKNVVIVIIFTRSMNLFDIMIFF